MNNFYIYQHKKADTNEIFYVGKGKDNRAENCTKRNIFWKNVEKKHGRIVEYLAKDLNEELAFLAEIEAIDVYRKRGITLTNVTNGGEGTSGYAHTEEHKAKLIGNTRGSSSWGKSFKGCKHSDETKAKWTISRLGNKNKLGKKISDEAKAKISVARKKYWENLKNG